MIGEQEKEGRRYGREGVRKRKGRCCRWVKGGGVKKEAKNGEQRQPRVTGTRGATRG